MTTTSGASRQAQVSRKTSETDIRVSIDLDGTGTCRASTGLGFLDHMLDALSKHSRIDLDIECKGDLHVDDHHSAEDCALALGQAIDSALNDRRGIARFGTAYAPMDESLCRCVLDLSGRPFSSNSLCFTRERLGDIATESLTHFFASLAMAARASIHVDLIRGENDHHKVEAAFKSMALALRQAIARDGGAQIPSTKGALS